MLINPNKAIKPKAIMLKVDSVKNTFFSGSIVHKGKTKGKTAEAITHTKR